VKSQTSRCLALLCLAIALDGAAMAKADNPCTGPGSRRLLCPDLRIGPPADLYTQETGGGRVLLRATSDVESRGRGPIEIRGRPIGRKAMKTHQRIYRKGGGHIDIPSRIRLHFTNVGYGFGGRYWKVHRLAVFQLWSVDSHHRPMRLVRTGPKTNYCLRDLERTRPGRHSPRRRHYPGCNQNPHRQAVTLGTSVGWSDIYPSDYDRQWINVAGLRGCFAYVMKVDPHNLLRESDERDNHSRRLVHLPFRADTGC
jgi:lysyl oxidase